MTTKRSGVSWPSAIPRFGRRHDRGGSWPEFGLARRAWPRIAANRKPSGGNPCSRRPISFPSAGRTALVTGGATGLGRVCAEALLAGGRARADRLAQGRGLRGGGEGALGDRSVRGLWRHRRDRGGRRRTRRRDAPADRRAAHPRQQRRHDLGRAVRGLSVEGVRPGPRRQRDRAVRADPRALRRCSSPRRPPSGRRTSSISAR